jgi:hypothetical protein
LRIDQPTEGFTYQWRRNGIAISQTSQTYIQGFLTEGEYSVMAENKGCTNESKSQQIYFENAPQKPILFAEGPVVWYLACSNDSAHQYKWYYNGNLIQGANTYLYVANKNLGTYSVSIGNDEGCFTSSDVITIPLIPTGLSDPDPFSGLKVYPNPTTGLFTIEMNNQVFGELDITIFTQEGRKIINIRFEKRMQYFSGQIDLNGQQEGTYLIKLQIDKYSGIRKLLVN